MVSARKAIQLRPATYDDLALLRYWDAQPHIIACDPNDDWQWEVELKKNPSWREQLVAELIEDGSDEIKKRRPIGFIQIIDPKLEEDHYWGEVKETGEVRAIDIWIGEVDCLGKGYGTTMMKLALKRCFNDPKVMKVWIDPLVSNTRAHRFYERLGFQFVELRQFGLDLCKVYELTREEV